MPATCRSRLCSNSRKNQPPVTLCLSAIDSPAPLSKAGSDDSKKPLLEVRDLTAVIAEPKQEILKGVNLVVCEREVHAIMGKNGSGKSTLSKVIGGSVVFKGENLLDMESEERSLAGLFMSFQFPVEIPGVNNIDFLNMACNALRKQLGEPELDPLEFYAYIAPKLDLVNMKIDFLNRNVNEGLVEVLGADLVILDEVDSGLDVDALRDVAKAVNALLTPKSSVLMITHYRRLLEFIKPNLVHVMEDGQITKTGDCSLAELLEKKGYAAISAL